jgi:tetratricopeptide (TPR) repeat protein
MGIVRVRVLRSVIIVLLLLTVALVTASVVSSQNDVLAKALRLDNQGQQDEAIALYRDVLARDPKSFGAHYGVARALDLKGNYAEAREHFGQAIALAPDDGSRNQALRMMGVSWVFVGDAKRATPFFKEVFDRYLKGGELAGAAEEANEIGRVLLELGDANGGLEWYRRGFETAAQQPNQSARDRDLADLRWAHAQARIAIRLGNRAEAQRHTAAVKSLIDKGTNPDQRVQYSYLAGYIAFYSKDDKKAIAELLQADQQDPFILLLIAEAYERIGDSSQAREYYRKVLGSNSHAVNNAFARPVARKKLQAAR